MIRLIINHMPLQEVLKVRNEAREALKTGEMLSYINAMKDRYSMTCAQVKEITFYCLNKQLKTTTI